MNDFFYVKDNYRVNLDTLLYEERIDDKWVVANPQPAKLKCVPHPDPDTQKIYEGMEE